MGDPLEPGTETGETEDELARRRARSVEDRAADGEGDPDAEAQEELPGMPPIELGDLPTTLKNLIPAKMPVEVTYSLMSAAVPGQGGLVDPEKDGQLIVSYEVHGYQPRPVRNPKTRKIERWKVVVQLRPTYIVPVSAANPAVANG